MGQLQPRLLIFLDGGRVIGTQAGSQLHNQRVEIEKLRPVTRDQRLGLLHPARQLISCTNTIPTLRIITATELIGLQLTGENLVRPAVLTDAKKIPRRHLIQTGDPAKALDSLEKITIDGVSPVEYRETTINSRRFHFRDKA